MTDKAWRPQGGEWERDCGCECFLCSEGIGHCDDGDLCSMVPAAFGAGDEPEPAAQSGLLPMPDCQPCPHVTQSILEVRRVNLFLRHVIHLSTITKAKTAMSVVKQLGVEAARVLEGNDV